jgi:hypothetical protein
MTTRIQALRSSTTQAVPAAGTRLPGELWTNFPDLQMGVIDASRNAQKLVGVRYFSTQANYAAGDFVAQAGRLYVANGPITAGAFSVSQWTQIASMTDVGAISPIGDNRIINGDMRIDQRNNGASGTAQNVYTVDRWQYVGAQPSKGAWVRGMSGAGLPQFPYNLAFTSSSAYASAAADTFCFYQPIEADMISDFSWGTASAQPVTLSFWTNANASGTYSGSIQNAAETRSYPFSFSIPTANIWTKAVITIPGDTTGAWVTNGNAASLFVIFDLGSGSSHRGPAGAWVSANYWAATGAVSVVATNGATFYVTGVKLEIGSVATPYNRQSLAKSMVDCQRYYQVGTTVTAYGYGTAASGLAAFQHWEAPVSMRATPTLVAAWGSGSNAIVGAIGMADTRTVQGSISSVAAGIASANLVITSLSAEL